MNLIHRSESKCANTLLERKIDDMKYSSQKVPRPAFIFKLIMNDRQIFMPKNVTVSMEDHKITSFREFTTKFSFFR